MRHRDLKSRIGRLLEQQDLSAALDTIRHMPGRQAVNPLFSLLYSGEEKIRWRAVTAMGAVVCQMADSAMESARVVMRRLMWNLNDESGGIGWGSPEAMGEITAGHSGLADEFACILISYIDPACNYLEHERLQRGVLWGIGRLTHARPLLAKTAGSFLPAYFESPDPYLRGTAIWAAGPILDKQMEPLVYVHLSDKARLRLYSQRVISATTVGELAREALSGYLVSIQNDAPS
jgi:hypothetical protein